MNIDEKFGTFKDFENVYLKATQPINIGNRQFEPGETIALFDKIQIAGLTEVRSYIAARGGFNNKGLVYWENTREMRLTFSQGVFSKQQFGLLNNARVLSQDNNPILITKVEQVETNDSGIATTIENVEDQIFLYDVDTGEKVNFTKNGNQLFTNKYNINLLVEYRYKYNSNATIVKIGTAGNYGFLELEGKTRFKNDDSGIVTTAIIKIPKIKLTSNLSLRIGASASPLVGNFEGVCIPVGERHESYVAEFFFLDDDLDSDM